MPWKECFGFIDVEISPQCPLSIFGCIIETWYTFGLTVEQNKPIHHATIKSSDPASLDVTATMSSFEAVMRI
jgi:hypothetical protein